MALSATASCNCLIPANNSFGLNRDDFVAVFADSTADIDANFDALNRAVSLLNVSFTQTQLAAFLGTVRSNTENLRRHRARCAETGTCAVQYDLVCSNRTVNDARHFYPRSALMISYQCNYGDIDSVLRSSLPCLKSIETEPDLISDRLLYSYLASIAAWTSTECMTLTANNLDWFGVCMNILNPLVCTDRGQLDRRDLIGSVNVALAALNISDVQLPSDMSCTDPVQSTIPSYSNVTSSNVTQSNVIAANASNVTNMTSTDIGFRVLSRDLFRSYFADMNMSLIDDNYNALIGALLLDDINQLDPKQIAFLLAAIKTRTANLTRLHSNSTDADRVRVPVQIILNLLSQDLRTDITTNVNPDLILFYISLINDVIRSGCMDDVLQGLYDVCMGDMFPSKICNVDEMGHDAIVDAIERALVLLNAGDDLSSLKCHDDDLTSHALISTSVSIWVMTSIVAGFMIMV